jgi:hypothetical protein
VKEEAERHVGFAVSVLAWVVLDAFVEVATIQLHLGDSLWWTMTSNVVGLVDLAIVFSAGVSVITYIVLRGYENSSVVWTRVKRNRGTRP